MKRSAEFVTYSVWLHEIFENDKKMGDDAKKY